VPTHVPLEKSKPYLVAKSLGANVTDRYRLRVTDHTIRLKDEFVKKRQKCSATIEILGAMLVPRSMLEKRDNFFS
jgi:hypothetical protein